MATEMIAVNGTTGEVTIPQPTMDASSVVAKAVEVASILAPALKDRNLTTRIQGKEYVLVEGWTLLAQMMGHTVGTTGTEPVEIDGAHGFMSHAVVKDPYGNVVGSADGICLRSEKSWARRDAYALAAMAQTRAMSRALRQRFGYVVALAGYEATSAEEMPMTPDQVTITETQVHGLIDAANENGLSPERAREIMRDVAGVASSREVPAAKYDVVVAAFCAAKRTASQVAEDTVAEFGGEVLEADAA